MNHNILKKIIDKMALEKWKDRIDNINQEYHSLFILDNDDIIRTRNKDLCRDCSHRNGYSAYNYRYNFNFIQKSYIWHQHFTNCKKCNNVVINSTKLCILHPDYREKN